MAIKGKKKSQSRGSQGVRRPAAAPRPTPTARRKSSWWRSRDGMLIGGIFLIVAIGVVVWLVVSAQDRAEQREQEAAALETYTDGLQPALDSVTPTANEMNEITALPEGDDLDGLAKDAETWVTDLQAGQAQIQAQFAPSEAQPVNDLLSESVGMYIAAAQTFALVPDAEGDLQAELFTRATDQRDSAGRVMDSAVGALDSLRAEKDLGPSGLNTVQAPMAQPTALPTTLPEVSPSAEGSGGNDSGGNDSGGNEDSGEDSGGKDKDGKKDAGDG
jgi:hypothetical protein